ncbi:MAG: undecaprenyl-diphosphate phosphatase [Thermoanaerobaculales bacterium]
MFFLLVSSKSYHPGRAVVAATGYDLHKTPRDAQTSPLGAVQMTPHGWVVLGIGFLMSFIVAYGVVAWFMSWVRHRGFAPFAICRIVAGAAVFLTRAGGPRSLLLRRWLGRCRARDRRLRRGAALSQFVQV